MTNETQSWPANPICATIILACSLVLGACNKNAPAAVEKNKTEAVTPSAPPPPTPADWKNALESTYVKHSVKDEGDGLESFTACFEPAAPDQKKKCGAFAFGKRDAFRKLRFYETGIPMMIGNGISTYVSLKDNELPILILTPYIFRKNWLFMNKIAVMVNGDVILEQDLNVDLAGQEIFPGGVQEHSAFAATRDQVHALRQIKPDSAVIIRFTGKKGYMTLDKADTSVVKSKIIEVLQVYDSIQKAVTDKIPPTGT
ncbi:hypothetical protein AEMCBJ_33510 (plasmid) [Cupriavidus necator]|uniref:hypothetical protein n=1 Tax=Cupriavidus necator TaxID=106590 RepID=UPI003F73D4F6